MKRKTRHGRKDWKHMDTEIIMPDYIRSLEHLRAWDGQFDEIWPSHASFPVFPDLIEKLHDGAQAVLDGSAAGRPTEIYGNRIREFDLGFAAFLCDP